MSDKLPVVADVPENAFDPLEPDSVADAVGIDSTDDVSFILGAGNQDEWMRFDADVVVEVKQ